MRTRRAEWDGPKHPEHDGLVALAERTGQVWEDVDGWIYFIVGSPEITCYEWNGRPFQYRHKVFVINSLGEHQDDWPLFETEDRPLELSELIVTRLA